VGFLCAKAHKKPHWYKPSGEKQYKDYEKNPFLFGGDNHLAFVIKVTVNIVSSMSDVHGAGNGIDAHVWSFSLVVSSSLCASSVRLSAFRMCHFTFILKC
jgi:hypothetical protein